jgi:hypothetical protein
VIDRFRFGIDGVRRHLDGIVLQGRSSVCKLDKGRWRPSQRTGYSRLFIHLALKQARASWRGACRLSDQTSCSRDLSCGFRMDIWGRKRPSLRGKEARISVVQPLCGEICMTTRHLVRGLRMPVQAHLPHTSAGQCFASGGGCVKMSVVSRCSHPRRGTTLRKGTVPLGLGEH